MRIKRIFFDCMHHKSSLQVPHHVEFWWSLDTLLRITLVLLIPKLLIVFLVEVGHFFDMNKRSVHPGTPQRSQHWGALIIRHNVQIAGYARKKISHPFDVSLVRMFSIHLIIGRDDSNSLFASSRTCSCTPEKRQIPYWRVHLQNWCHMRKTKENKQVDR